MLSVRVSLKPVTSALLTQCSINCATRTLNPNVSFTYRAANVSVRFTDTNVLHPSNKTFGAQRQIVVIKY